MKRTDGIFSTWKFQYEERWKTVNIQKLVNNIFRAKCLSLVNTQIRFFKQNRSIISTFALI